MNRLLPVLAALLVSTSVLAQQPQIGVPPALEVARLAPQLIPFLGSRANFQNLVNGLALGLPVTLTTTGADGFTRIVTFTPVGPTLQPLQIAQTLELARQQLISRGIGAPTGEQVAVVLQGGTLPTVLGGVAVPGLLQPIVATTTPSAAAGGSAPSPSSLLQQQVFPAVNPGFSVRNTSDSTLPRNVSDTTPQPVPAVTGGTSTTPGTTVPVVTPAPAAPLAPSVLPRSAAGPRFGSR